MKFLISLILLFCSLSFGQCPPSGILFRSVPFDVKNSNDVKLIPQKILWDNHAKQYIEKNFDLSESSFNINFQESISGTIQHFGEPYTKNRQTLRIPYIKSMGNNACLFSYETSDRKVFISLGGKQSHKASVQFILKCKEGKELGKYPTPTNMKQDPWGCF